MNRITAALLALALSAPLAGLAQQKESYGQGGSPRCESLAGNQKDECLKAEGAKTEPKALGDSAAAGGTRLKDATQSARCDQLTGAQRDQCLNDEGAKTDTTKEAK
jgi:hypothetical protein